MSFRTIGVAVAVNAKIGTPCNMVRNLPKFLTTYNYIYYLKNTK